MAELVADAADGWLQPGPSPLPVLDVSVVEVDRRSESSLDEVDESCERVVLLLAVGECAEEPPPSTVETPLLGGDDGRADERPERDGPARDRVNSRHLAAARAATVGRRSCGWSGAYGRDERRWSGGVGRPVKEVDGLVKAEIG
jgi:hypothetical protein